MLTDGDSSKSWEQCVKKFGIKHAFTSQRPTGYDIKIEQNITNYVKTIHFA